MTFSARTPSGVGDHAPCAEEGHGYPLTAGAEENTGQTVVQPDLAEQPLQEAASPSPLTANIAGDSGTAAPDCSKDARVDCPPSTDRGAEKPSRFGRRVDWCEFSISQVEPEEVERVVGRYVPGGFIEGGGSFYGYHEQRLGPGAARILFDSTRPETHVILPGKWCAAVDESQMRGLLLWADANGGATTRLDLATDDFEQRVTPVDVREAILAGQMVTHSKKARLQETLLGDDGTTVYVGAATSRVVLRVYDKAKQSRGAVMSIRWELVLRKQAAQAIQRDLAVRAWAPLFNSQLLRFADFRDREADPKIARCPRLWWYDEIIGDVTKARPYMPTPVYSAEKSMRHFKRNQAPVLAALVASQGGAIDWLHQGLRDARRRWTEKHRIIANDNDFARRERRE